MGDSDRTRALALKWCFLNAQEWPPDIVGFSDHIRDAKERTAMRREIQSTIGLDACLREWNLRKFYNPSLRILGKVK